MTPPKRWKVYLIHHTHTDIGYTDRQEKIEANQVDFLRQVLSILDAVQTGSHPEWSGFRWTCETYWAVERFWDGASQQEKAAFVSAVQKGDVEVGANYLNLCELAGHELFSFHVERAMKWAAENGIDMRSAMIADVNGYSWGWGRCLADRGVENLFACVHSYRGMFPGWIKQRPFYWEMPDGKKILVWNAEHYQIGNEFGIVPGSLMSWTLSADEFQGRRVSDDTVTLTRLGRYLDQLEHEEYPYDFVPVTVHGLATDNAPPDPEIAVFVSEWNRTHGERIELELTTLTPFFEQVRAHSADIPVFRGDWPDWWSDGVGSTPLATGIFRQTQRAWETLLRLDPDRMVIDDDEMNEAAYRLMLFAEHTWGLHLSVENPFNPLVNLMIARKQSFAVEANRLVSIQVDRLLASWGDQPLSCRSLPACAVYHHGTEPLCAPVHFELEGFERPLPGACFSLVDAETGQRHEVQASRGLRGNALTAILALEPGKIKRCRIVPESSRKRNTTASVQNGGVDGVCDILPLEHNASGTVRFGENRIESDFLCIRWQTERGVFSWFDKTGHQEWIDPERTIGAFTPVYEKTPATPDQQMTITRNRMGRNRKGVAAERSEGQLFGVRLVESGPVYCTAELAFEVSGCRSFTVSLTLYASIPRVEVSVRIQKDAVWESENLYLALPFSAGPAQDLWISKANVPVRLWKDQIPGSLTDFYCVNEGVVLDGPKGAFAIAMPDTPLIQTGTLHAEERVLQGHPELEKRKPELFSWPLNNHWETNFKASTEGFHCFRFVLQADCGLGWCKNVLDPPLVFRSKT